MLLARNRNFRRLAISSAVSGIGDWMFGLALAVWVLDRTGSPTWVALSIGARMAPYALFGAIGGMIADRFERRRVLITFDLIRAVLLGLLVLVAATGAPVILGVALATALAAAATPYRPAMVAVVPSIVADDDLTAANSIEAAICQTLMFAGPALTAALLRLVAPTVVFALDGLTFVISALLVARLPRTGTPARPATDDGGSWTQELRAGIAAVRSQRGIVALLACVGVSTLAFGAMLVTHVVFVQARFGLPAGSAGFVAGACALGGLLATGLARRIGDAVAPARVLTAGMLLIGGSMLSLSLVGNFALALLVAAPEGIGSVLFEVVGIATLQRRVPSEFLGRVYGLQDTIVGGGQMVGALVAPVVIMLFGPAGCVAAFGVAVAIAGLALQSRLRALEPEPEVQYVIGTLA